MNFKKMNHLKKASVVEVLDSTNDKFPFKVSFFDSSEIAFMASNRDEKIDWTQKILQVINSLSPSTFLVGSNIPEPFKRASVLMKDAKSSSSNLKRTDSGNFPKRSNSSLSSSSNKTNPEDEWKTLSTPDGKTYYFNAKTMQTSWEKPNF